MSVSFVLPTRDRAGELSATLERIGAYPKERIGAGGEVIVVDNASEPRAAVPTRLGNGLAVELIRCEENLGTAARNLGARAARNAWVVMLDDDSSPMVAGEGEGDFAWVLGEVSPEVAAVGGEILLPDGTHEAGGLPKVIVGCGAAVRRDAFLEVGGYDAAFEYYAEEYDLCAKLIAAGYRVGHTRRLRFEHRKVRAGRDFGRILRRLVRNNGWVIERYAPAEVREAELGAMLARYAAIGRAEGVSEDFWVGKEELRRTIGGQVRRPFDESAWERFTGAAAVRETVVGELRRPGVTRVRIVERGKGAEVVERELRRARVVIDEGAEVSVVGRLSPGPVLDAGDRGLCVGVWERGVFGGDRAGTARLAG